MTSPYIPITIDLHLNILKHFLHQEHWHILTQTATHVEIEKKEENINFYGGEDKFDVDYIRYRQMFPAIYNKLEVQIVTPVLDNCTHDYESSSSKVYVYKMDLFFLLQQIKCVESNNITFFAIIAHFMKTKLDEMGYTDELVEIDERYFLRQEYRFKTVLGVGEAQKPKLTKARTLKEIFAKVKEILPVNKKDPEYRLLYGLLSECGVGNITEDEIYQLELIFKEMNSFIAQNPTLFKAGRPTKGIAIVRLFDIGSFQFVLTSELLKETECAGLHVSTIKKMVLNMDKLEFIRHDILGEKLNDEYDKIEFVKVPIEQVARQSVPVPTPDGKYSIPTGDVFLKYVRDKISIHSILHGASADQLKEVTTAFENYAEQFAKLDHNESIFFDMDLIPQLHEQNETLRNFQKLKRDQRPINKIRVNFFTCKDLLQQARQLGLGNLFSNHQRMCELAYQEIHSQNYDSTKDRTRLTTADMYSALELFQVNALIWKSEPIKKFLHQHRSCSRLLYACRYCKLDEFTEKLTNAQSGIALARAREFMDAILQYAKNADWKIAAEEVLDEYKIKIEEYKEALSRSITWLQENPEGNAKEHPSIPPEPLFKADLKFR